MTRARVGDGRAQPGMPELLERTSYARHQADGPRPRDHMRGREHSSPGHGTHRHEPLYAPHDPGSYAGARAHRAGATESIVIEGTDTGIVPKQDERSGRLSWTAVARRTDAIRHTSPDTWAIAAIALVVLLANLPYLLGFFDPNALDFRSGLTSALTRGALTGKMTIDPSNGFTSQAIGHLAALDLLHLHLPWWNPYEATGMPLLGETQSAALFVPTLLTALANGQLYEHILLEATAGICTYFLLRRILHTRSAALAGAIAFALNGKFAWFADATVNPLPFLPMLLLGIERAYDAALHDRPGGWRLVALAGALAAYAGFPEVAYPNTLMAVCWLGWRLGCLPGDRRRALLAKAGLGAVAGTLLAAPILVAMATYLSHADLGIHSSAQLGSRHLTPAALPQLFMPYVYGEVNADPHAITWIRVGGYLSTALLLLAALGVLAPGRRGLKLVLLGWTVLVFSRMYGLPPLLGHVLGVLPDMSRIQFYRYGTAALELPVIILAALGLDDLARIPGHRRRLMWAALGMIALTVGAALYARPTVRSLGSAFHHDAFFRASILWGALIAAAMGAVAFLGRQRVRPVLLTMLLAVDALVLFVVPEFAAPRSATIDLAPVRYLQTHLGDGRFYSLGPIMPNYGSYFSLGELGVDDFPPKLYANYVRTHVDPGVAFTGFRPKGRPTRLWELTHHVGGYRFAGVQYIVAAANQRLPQGRSTFQRVFHSPTVDIYHLAGASPYFTAGGCAVGSTTREDVRIDCAQATTLIRRETWMPGWTAQVDGRPTVIHQSHGLFQSVRVPAGSHRVTFAFTPPGMGWAGLALLGGCLMMLVPTVRRRGLVSLRRAAPAS